MKIQIKDAINNIRMLHKIHTLLINKGPPPWLSHRIYFNDEVYQHCTISLTIVEEDYCFEFTKLDSTTKNLSQECVTCEEIIRLYDKKHLKN